MSDKNLQNVNLDLLQEELGRDIQGIADMLDMSAQTVYKWRREKSKGGCRPKYEEIYTLLNAGASLKSLFGIENYSGSRKKEVNKEDFMAGVRQALAELAAAAQK